MDLINQPFKQNEEHFDIPAFLRRQADDSLSISSSDSSMSSDYEDYDFAVRSDPRTEEDSPETFAFELNIQFQGIKILGEGEFPSDLDDLSFRIDKNLLENCLTFKEVVIEDSGVGFDDENFEN